MEKKLKGVRNNMVKYLDIKHYHSQLTLPITRMQAKYVEDVINRGIALPDVVKLMDDPIHKYIPLPCNYILDNVEFKDKELVGAEIGVWTGVDALTFLEMLKIKKLYLIDPYSLYDEYDGSDYKKLKPDEVEKETKEKLKKYEDKIEFIKKFSEEAINDIPDNLDFVYIDGNHSYEYCKRDMDLYWKKLRVGGILGGDDLGLHCPGVCKAVGEFILENNLHLIERRCRSMFEDWIIIK